MLAAAAVVAGLLSVPAASGAPATAGARAPQGPADHRAVPDPDRVLPDGWRKSPDRAVTLAADVGGVHVMVADSAAAYRWRTVTTLSEPGFAPDLWTGNYCLADRSHAVVVYAPRAFTNHQELMERGAFTAVVDLGTGAVTKLALNASLAYFDPSCDTVTRTAAITQLRGDRTRVVTVDTRGRTVSARTAGGQVTSAAPMGADIVAASGNHLVRIARDGTMTTLATASGTPYAIHADGGGGVDFLDQTQTGQRARRVAGHRTVTLATGAIGSVGLAAGAGGTVFLTGAPEHTGRLPGTVRRVAAPPQADLSSDGALAVDRAVTPALHSAVAVPAAGTGAAAGETVRIDATVTASGRTVGFTADSSAAHRTDAVRGTALSPSLARASSGRKGTKGTGTSPAVTGSVTTVDTDRYCSIARNDPNTMALQPTPNQVEWAVDMAVRGDLTTAYVPGSGWRATEGLGSVNPQGLFPLPALNTGGQIPSQVLLGVLAQESNLWQASSHAEPGEFGNPLVGNFYGVNIYPGTSGYDPGAIWVIDWAKSDCGYGVGQVTDGMRMAGHTKPNETALAPALQRALALDYTVNIAYAARILAQKWNELHSSTVTLRINNDDPARPENWFAAAWDYNSGFNKPGSASNWGLGWYNNPANPIYPPSRHPFLDDNTYSDAAKPQNWPYEEKVEGWAAWPIDTGRSYNDSGTQQSKDDPGYSSAGYAAAWWVNDTYRSQVKPPLGTFCDASNACAISSPPTCELDHSGDPSCDTPHWYHQSATWKSDCATSCGHGQIRYVTLRTEPGNASPSPPPCSSTLPSGTVVVDDVPASAVSPRCPGSGFTTQGTFSFSFPLVEGHYEAREDLQQIGGGFDGHYWFSHGRQDGNWDNALQTTGTWTPSSLPTHLYQIRAYMPYLGGKTRKAVYRITADDGTVYKRTVDQSAQTAAWMTIGYYRLASNAKVELTNTTTDPTSGDTTVAYDALAFTPVTGTFQHHSFTAASIFPSDIDLDTNFSPLPDWLMDSPLKGRQALYDWAHGLSSTLADLPVCPAGQTAACLGSDMSQHMRQWSAQVEAAGTDPRNHPSQADWMSLDNALPPQTITGSTFDDPRSFKIKTVIDTSWVMGGDGKVVPGTEHAEYTARSGDTDLPTFAVDFMNDTERDYAGFGVTVPDVSFDATDANEYGHSEFVRNPVAVGLTPGREYVPKSEDASIDETGKCVKTKIVSGGVMGMRMLLAAPDTDKNVAAWKDKLASLAAAGKIPQAVATTAAEIYNLLFHGLGSSGGSLFNIAPPIWQNVSMAFCTDGSVHDTQNAADTDDDGGFGLVYQSHMPDLYLYLDGRMVDEGGNPATGPVQRGDFSNFTQGGYGLCQSAGRGNGGNPWAITLISSVGTRPDNAAYCDANPPPPVG
ncbi:MAG: Tat pathway signal protein [Streptomyces sp.]|nr:Tat pathway signal protein [Streptomyces sp.]